MRMRPPLAISIWSLDIGQVGVANANGTADFCYYNDSSECWFPDFEVRRTSVLDNHVNFIYDSKVCVSSSAPVLPPSCLKVRLGVGPEVGNRRYSTCC